MRLTPRKEEVQQVVDILESDQYSSAADMAKALIKEIADMLEMRDWVALTHRYGDTGMGINWGPFSSPIEANRYAEKVGAGGKWATVKLYSPGLLLANAQGAKKPTKDFCTNPICMHAQWTHSAVGTGRGHCVLELCGCEKYTSK